MKKVPLLLMFLSFSTFASLESLNALKPPYTVPDLPYAYDSLEVAIDAQTMRIHHDKHHQAYVDKLNKETEGKNLNLLTLFKTVSKQSDAVRNNGGGHWNHSFFWTVLSSNKDLNIVPIKLKAEIEKKFGSWDKFKEAFEDAGKKRFGSGWVWLVRNAKNELEITSTPNQDNPLMDVAPVKGRPILGADVWEHAYYLKYQNKRDEYLKNFWTIINWKQVQEYNLEAQMKRGDF